jgi:hypothetical protein
MCKGAYEWDAAAALEGCRHHRGHLRCGIGSTSRIIALDRSQSTITSLSYPALHYLKSFVMSYLQSFVAVACHSRVTRTHAGGALVQP